MKFFLLLSLLTSLLFAVVDINTATVEELASLKDIGVKKAKRIIKYREEHGCFKDLKEFKKVKGIKKKTIKKNKGNIVVSECKKP
ncbi:ComEA family DNA-binding protein [Sulfurimonas marina]|uniref:Helix-hairpin-helix domain-containing protein n=1 Tax=Sulfurimonas marina TaxID=2590551 RepID=A0A7M3V9B4_9BACT|nr:helix-hairpin-helix domain-containing protein [Sulfurimonas marina]QOP40347.1 helix-hairpin-helix domain-containing protein [Sulfurimonas marina]